ncbi:TIGR04104 family putative zinc finger protein [Lentibacillus jeotgali]|uniref:TIGR04104 family putative zinc finger protein n=1 Tax=Lentibacillus jeotgali TaxID=558169 RepID=UPI000262931C|nr:TIGR04104 family putative zinc finger protein [Lentibacillus jeotgali]
MPICQSCGKRWTWKQTIKTIFKLKCPYCGEKQYESASSRIRSGVFWLIPLVILPINAGFGFSVGTALFIAIILVFIILGLYPFILKLSNEEEPYW